MKKIKFIFLFLLLFVLALGAVGLYFYNEFLPPSGNQSVTFDIPKNSSTQDIADILEKKNLIKNVLVFRLYTRYKNEYQHLQAGTYVINQGTSMDGILDIISNGKVKIDTYRFTIPEGYTIAQISKLLSDKGYVNEQKFLYEADKGVFQYDFLNEANTAKNVKHRLEGYLFPDTYEVKVGTSEHDIIDMMLKRFNEVVTLQMRDQFAKNGLTLHQAITMASMVEREAKVNEERSVIASVMYNRLHSQPPMPLEIDATLQYVLLSKGVNRTVSQVDLQSDDPFNTYKYTNLPPGPIASPGKDCLLAVAYPASSSYLYYVAKADGSGGHYFSQTYAEHLQNIQKSDENEKKSK